MRPCAKCSTMKPFVPTDQFRINAQKKLLDVWLIYQCIDCGHTWNLTLFERISPKQLDRALYDRLLSNDAALIEQYAFDVQLHANRHAPLCYDALRYEIEGETPAMDTPCELIFDCSVPLGIKASKLIREVLQLSGAQFDALTQQNALRSLDGKPLRKRKMTTHLHIQFDPPCIIPPVE